jgi:ABC-type uncharacterized transport system permease subunit
MDHWPLFASSFFLLCSFGYTLFSLGAGKFRPAGANFPLIAAAFVFQTLYLYKRGLAIGACPLNTIFDAMIFLGWAVALMYLVIGPAYRLSLLGAFTAPLLLLLQIAALLFRDADGASAVRSVPPNVWVELHGALSVVAYGGFGLAAVSALMFLLQDHFLKYHRLTPLFFNLPPVEDLGRVTPRLVAFGFILLTVSFAAGMLSRLPVEWLKIGVSIAIWFAFGMSLALRKLRRISTRRFAWTTVVVFVLAVLTLPGIHYFSVHAP